MNSRGSTELKLQPGQGQHKKTQSQATGAVSTASSNQLTKTSKNTQPSSKLTNVQQSQMIKKKSAMTLKGYESAQTKRLSDYGSKQIIPTGSNSKRTSQVSQNQQLDHNESTKQLSNKLRGSFVGAESSQKSNTTGKQLDLILDTNTNNNGGLNTTTNNQGGAATQQASIIKQKYSMSITGSTQNNQFESLLPQPPAAANPNKHIVPMNQISLAINPKGTVDLAQKLDGSQSQRVNLNSTITRPTDSPKKKSKLTSGGAGGGGSNTKSYKQQPIEHYQSTTINHSQTPQQTSLKASMISSNKNGQQAPSNQVSSATKKSSTFIEVPQQRTFAQSFHSSGNDQRSQILQTKGLASNAQAAAQGGGPPSQVKVSKVSKFIDLRGGSISSGPGGTKNNHTRTISETVDQQATSQLHMRTKSNASQGALSKQQVNNKLEKHRFSLPSNSSGVVDKGTSSKAKDNMMATATPKKKMSKQVTQVNSLTQKKTKNVQQALNDFDSSMKAQKMHSFNNNRDGKSNQQKIMKLITKVGGTNQQSVVSSQQRLSGTQTTKGSSVLIPSSSHQITKKLSNKNDLNPSSAVAKKNLKAQASSQTSSAQKEKGQKSRLSASKAIQQKSNNYRKIKTDTKEDIDSDNDDDNDEGGLPQTCEVDDLYVAEGKPNNSKLQLVSSKKIYSNSVLSVPGSSNNQLLGSFSQSNLKQNWPQKTKPHTGSLVSSTGSARDNNDAGAGNNSHLETTPRIKSKTKVPSSLQNTKMRLAANTSAEKPPLKQFKGISQTSVNTPSATKYASMKDPQPAATNAYGGHHKRIESDGSVLVNQYISKIFGNSPLDFMQELPGNASVAKPHTGNTKDVFNPQLNHSCSTQKMNRPRSGSKDQSTTPTKYQLQQMSPPLKGSTKATGSGQQQQANTTQKRDAKKKQNFQLFQQTQKQQVTTATKKLNDHSTSGYSLSFASTGNNQSFREKQPFTKSNIMGSSSIINSVSSTPKATLTKKKFQQDPPSSMVSKTPHNNFATNGYKDNNSNHNFSTRAQQQVKQNNYMQSSVPTSSTSHQKYNTASQVSSSAAQQQMNKKLYTPQQTKPQTFKPAQLSITHQTSGNENILEGSENRSDDILVVEERYDTQEAEQNLTPRTKQLHNLKKKIRISFSQTGIAPATQIDYYKIGKVMGKGAFGKVNLAIHRFSNKFVALKSINKEFMVEEESKKKVMQEFNILRRARHKNIVRLYESFETPQHIVFVMEVCGGGDLLTYVRKRRKLKEDVARHLFTQIIKGIQYCHQKNVLHRDIKLDNILLTSQGNVKICDFGVSKLAKPDQIMFEQCGTPAYIAPEVFSNKGKGYQGYASDVWSAGVVLYAMLYGAVPFKASNMAELQKQIVTGTPQYKDDISQEALELLKQILEKNPKQRLTTAQILKHPWMMKRKSQTSKRAIVFTDNEQKAILSEFEYYNVAKEKPGTTIAQGKEGENLPTDPFADQMLHSTENDLLRNVSTKSIILAPFNSTRSQIDIELSQDKSVKALLMDKKCIKFSAKVKELDRQYELNNNADLDNGVYHQNSKEDQAQSTQKSMKQESSLARNSEFAQGTLNNQSEAIKSHLNDFDDKTQDQIINELNQENQRGENSEWKRIEKMIIESQMDEQRKDSVYQMTEEDDPATVLNGGITLKIEENYVAEVMKVGYPRSFVYSSLNNDELNHASMFYYLLTISREF